jgi:predicted CoA-binding protein
LDQQAVLTIPQPSPRRVAVIGASNDRHKFGNKAVRAFVRRGYDVVPINPHETHVEGLRAFRSVLDVTGPIDMATVYVRPDIGLQIVTELAQKGITEVWFNPGADSPALIARARELGLDPIQACSIVGIGESPQD